MKILDIVKMAKLSDFAETIIGIIAIVFECIIYFFSVDWVKAIFAGLNAGIATAGFICYFMQFQYFGRVARTIHLYCCVWMMFVAGVEFINEAYNHPAWLSELSPKVGPISAGVVLLLVSGETMYSLAKKKKEEEELASTNAEGNEMEMQPLMRQQQEHRAGDVDLRRTSNADVVSPSSSDGELADSGGSEAVASTSNGNGGKTPLVLKRSLSVGVSMKNLMDSHSRGENSSAASMTEEAWERLSKSYVYFEGQRVGTFTANDDASSETLNYNQVFVRDFVPTGLACLMKPDADVEIVKNFLLKTLHLQGREKRIDKFTLGKGVMPASFKGVMPASFKGVMPASFKVIQDPIRQREVLQGDFGGNAIGGVAPVDSGFWWIILLHSYTVKCTQDCSLAELPEVQRGIKLILNPCLSDGFDTFPTLLCEDGCSMIDRRMGVDGYPIEIQALFFFALRCARQLLKPEDDGQELIERIDKRITALNYHMQNNYWLDITQLNNEYRYKTEEYSNTAANKFNVIPGSIPQWVFDFMPRRGGYFIGNVSQARKDFRWFLVGNCIAILSSLATAAQATAIMDLIEEQWTDLIGEMPLKITYPALEGDEWKIVTRCDPKNRRWSYHNGGSWPVLLWLLTAASIKTERPQIAKKAIELVEKRLSKDGWPEYYDGVTGCFIGKQARKYQTWSIAGYLVAKLMIENPSNLLIISLAFPGPQQSNETQMQTAGPSKDSSTGQPRGTGDVGGQGRSTAIIPFHGSSGRMSTSAIMERIPSKWPRPVWHAPWKNYRVISGHLGCVQSVAVDPSNTWFCTGSADRTIKIWDLASGQLKLTLTGHIDQVRGLAVSNKHRYMFSAGDDKFVKCWDLEQNKVIHSYHGHLSGVYCLALHPTIDILLTGGRDSMCRVWDIRSKVQILTLPGHDNTVCSVFTRSTDPQVITGSHDSTIKLWDLRTGKTLSTLTHHKNSVRAMAPHPTEDCFVSASAENIKKFKLPRGEFMHNMLSQQNTIINSAAVNEAGIMATSGDNGSLWFWDWTSGHNFQQAQTIVQPGSLDSEAGIYSIMYDLTGSRLITCEADKTIKMWKEDEDATPETHPLHFKPPSDMRRF